MHNAIESKNCKRNIKIIVMYDGSSYSGWQRLETASKHMSIQGILEKTISKVLGEDIKVIGSGRTDAGVHSMGQRANFYTKSNINIAKIKRGVNEQLPEDVKITDIKEVSGDFHSRFSADSKTYEYNIDRRERQSVFRRKYSYGYNKALDIKRMRKAAEILIGEHDFTGFSSQMKSGKSSIRTIYNIEIIDGEVLKIKITGNGFLYNMVRIIVGTLLEIGSGDREINTINEILNKKDRSLAGATAPYQGLFLLEVIYK